MAIEVKIPSVGESITSGVVSAWHKKSGEFVNEGEALFTLETDKVSTEIVAEKSGVLEAKVPEGQEVKIGEVVATIDDSKQPPREKKEEKPKKKEPEEKKPQPDKEPAAVERGRPQPTTAATTLSPAVRRIVEEEKLEPENMGAWTFIEPRLRTIFCTEIAYAGREASASPAVGALARHKREQARLVADALSV